MASDLLKIISSGVDCVKLVSHSIRGKCPSVLGDLSAFRFFRCFSIITFVMCRSSQGVVASLVVSSGVSSWGVYHKHDLKVVIYNICFVSHHCQLSVISGLLGQHLSAQPLLEPF